MTNSILSLWRVFFIDDDNVLWAVNQHHKADTMKTVPSFSVFSSDRTVLTGVSFDGVNTNILWTYANFTTTPATPILSVSGYCYYPAVLNHVKSKLAIIRVDLLQEKGVGELILYDKVRKKYHMTDTMPCAVSPPYFSKSGTLYYISPTNHLISQGVDNTILYDNVRLFTLNNAQTEFAVYGQDTIHWIDFKKGVVRQFIAFDVSAIGFNEKGDCLFFATYKNGRSSLYQYHKITQEIDLILNHATKITSISF